MSMLDFAIMATTEYITQVHASVEHGNLFACQFHPEKSHNFGMLLLENFVKRC